MNFNTIFNRYCELEKRETVGIARKKDEELVNYTFALFLFFFLYFHLFIHFLPADSFQQKREKKKKSKCNSSRDDVQSVKYMTTVPSGNMEIY